MRLSVISWFVCVLGLVALAVLVGPKFLAAPPHNTQTGKALIGGDFTLIDGTGKPLSDSAFRGRYMLVYFGFTHCPDICPTTLLVMTNALKKLGDLSREIVPIFISLDPERDTPEIVSTYVQNFSPNLVGLTGSKKQITQVADNYKVYFKKVKVKNSALGYMVDHSGFIYLMGPDGNYVAHFDHTLSEQALVDGLRKHVKGRE